MSTWEGTVRESTVKTIVLQGDWAYLRLQRLRSSFGGFTLGSREKEVDFNKKCSVFNKKNYRTYKESEKYDPLTGKSGQWKLPLRAVKHWI